MREIIQAKYIEPYIIELVFDDLKKGRANLRPFLNKGIFQSLRDEKKFKQFTLDKELGTIVWKNGADIAPETLYQEIA